MKRRPALISVLATTLLAAAANAHAAGEPATRRQGVLLGFSLGSASLFQNELCTVCDQPSLFAMGFRFGGSFRTDLAAFLEIQPHFVVPTGPREHDVLVTLMTHVRYRPAARISLGVAGGVGLIDRSERGEEDYRGPALAASVAWELVQRRSFVLEGELRAATTWLEIAGAEGGTITTLGLQVGFVWY